ncbi:MAG: DNA polymerase I, partial [Anaerolineales bacterium]
IVTDVPIDFDLDACRAAGYDRDAIADLFRDLEFRTLLDRIPGAEKLDGSGQMNLFVSSDKKATDDLVETTTINDQAGLSDLREILSRAEAISFDVETTSTDPMKADLVGISVAVTPSKGFYIPIGHDPNLAGADQLTLEKVIEVIRDPMIDRDIPKVGHNLKYDYLVLARHGLEPTPLAFDTMIAEWLCDPASRNLGLKNLAWVRLGLEMTEITELIGKGRNQRTMDKLPVDEVAPYAAADAAICLHLMPQLESELKTKEQWDLFNDVEMPLVPILAGMERAGILLDSNFLDELSDTMQTRLDEIQNEIFRIVGHEFNVNSTQQLSAVLFDELKLTPPDRTRKTSSGFYSTAASVLEELQSQHEIATLVLEYREISKLKSTYADAFPQQVNPETGRVHTSYNQTGSVTGRLASSDPNLQNIPIRTELGREIRRAFVPKPDHLLLSTDYSQIELRIVAHIAEDKAMIEAFQNDQDIHSATAAAISGIPLEDVTPDMRRNAKAINFGLIYGMSPYGLTRTTDLTLGEAENFVDAYFERFPGVKSYLDEVRERVTIDGYVSTLLGRRRYFPQLEQGSTVNETIRSRALREAINAPIQGTAADIIKLAMLELPEQLEKAGLKASMLLQVHDELVFECPSEELDQTAPLVEKVMQEAYKLDVPLKTDTKVGENWADMKPIE